MTPRYHTCFGIPQVTYFSAAAHSIRGQDPSLFDDDDDDDDDDGGEARELAPCFVLKSHSAAWMLQTPPLGGRNSIDFDLCLADI